MICKQSAEPAASRNLKAFLSMIAASEGTSSIPGSDDGYRALVGGTVFEGYADHPRVRVDLGDGLVSTAAGRYQILERYFDSYRMQLHLPDFGPASQDAIATQMICEQHAYADIVAGRFDLAVGRVANIWASLPGARYGQHVNRMTDLRRTFTDAGGTLA